jgi:hypothetical protein
MFVALDPNENRIGAWEADRGPFACPACRGSVVLKRGAIVAAHFAHRPDAVCAVATGESERHHAMKWRMASLLGFDDVRFEVAFAPERRADLVMDRCVIECQASPISVVEWEARTRFYNERKHYVLWVWDESRLGQENDWLEQRIPAEIRHCHRMSWGHVALLYDDGDLYDAHFYAVSRASEFMGEVFDRTLKATKLVERRWIERPSIRRMTGPEGHILGDLGQRAWWRATR